MGFFVEIIIWILMFNTILLLMPAMHWLLAGVISGIISELVYWKTIGYN